MTNSEKLVSVIDKAQTARKAFLTEVQSLSQAEFNFKPSRDAWSIGEVIHHVGLSEEHWQRTMTELFKSGAESGRANPRPLWSMTKSISESMCEVTRHRPWVL